MRTQALITYNLVGAAHEWNWKVIKNLSDKYNRISVRNFEKVCKSTTAVWEVP